MGWGAFRSVTQTIQEDLEEQQRTYAVGAQGSAFKAWMTLGQPAPGMAAAMNPIGKEYLKDRMADDSLRPSNFFDTVIARLNERRESFTPIQSALEFGEESLGFADPIRRDFEPQVEFTPVQRSPAVEAQRLGFEGAANPILALQERQQQSETERFLAPFADELDMQSQFLRDRVARGEIAPEEAEAAFSDFFNEVTRGNVQLGGGPFGTESALGGFMTSFVPQNVREAAGEVPFLGPGLERSLEAASPLGLAAAGGGARLGMALGQTLPRALGEEAAAEGAFLLGRSLTEPIDNPFLREGLPLAAAVGTAALPVFAPRAAQPVARAGAELLDTVSPPRPVFALDDEFVPPKRLTPGQEAVPPVEPPRVSDVTEAVLPPEDPVAKLLRLVKSAEPVREATEALKSAELGRRAGTMAGTFERETGEEAFIRAQKAQAGELPKAAFEPPRPAFDQTEIDELFDIARVDPKLTPFERANAGRALFDTLMGELPTRGEISLIGKVWGTELAEELLKKRGFWANFAENTLDALNIPRSIITAFDLSAPFRQGVLMTVGHPKEFFGNISTMIKSFARLSVADQVDTILKTGPKAQRRQSAGIFHAELGDVAQLTEREEAFMSRLVTRIPVVGSVVKRSQTAYTTFLNKLRADVFDNIVRGWDKSPGKFSKADEKELADMINKFTGRGNLPGLGQYQGLISQTLFSSRLLASRVQAPVTVFSKSKAVRMQAARDLSLFIGTGLGILGLAKLGGADVNITDPLSANFGKIKVGPTRVDVWGGYTPLVRFAARVATGKSTSSLGNKFDLDRDQAVLQFLRSKLSPQAGLLTDVVQGKTFLGEELQPDPATFKTQTFNRLVPLFIQDLVDAIREQGVKGAGLAAPAFFGVGVQTYVTAAEAERDARREVFAERQGQPAYSKYETLEDLINADDVLLAEIDKDERVIAAQERRNFTSEESEQAELRVTEFMEQQEPRDDLLQEFFRTGGESGTSPKVWGDELSDAQAELFAKREEIFSDIDFGDDPPPEDSVNAAMEAYFAVDIEQYTDQNTREVDFDSFFKAKDAALTPLGSQAGTVRDYISRNFETETVTAMRKIADGITEPVDARGRNYYDRPIGSSREKFRRFNQGFKADAALWIAGSVTAVLTNKAREEVVRLLQQWFNITISPREVPKR